MSDFLNNFSGNNYNKMLEEKNDIPDQKSENIVDKDKTVIKNVEADPKPLPLQSEIPEKKVQADTLIDFGISAGKTGEVDLTPQKQAETFAKLEGATLKDESLQNRRDFEEEVEVDGMYQKQKIMKYSIIGAATLVVSIAAFLIFFLNNQVIMPSFVDKPYADARTWALKNRVEIEATQSFSIEFDENQVVTQSIPEAKKIQKGAVVKMTISKGADPDQKVQIPDFATMRGPAIEEWIKKNKVTNLKVVKEFSDTIEKDTFLRLEFKTPEKTINDYFRKDNGTVYLSKGKEVFEQNVVVPNFAGKTKHDVETFVKENLIEMTYDEGDSATIAAGEIMSQSITAGEKIRKKDAMTVMVSVGRAVVIPYFGSMTKEDATIYGSENGLQVTIREFYSSKVAYGDMISQSIQAGARLTTEDKTISVQYSIGKPYIEDLTTAGKAMTEKDIALYFYEFRAKNAEITYKIHHVASAEPRGTIVDMSKKNEFVSMYEHVDIYVSQ
ncbi:hypothetical protein AwErysi_05220 [Erysipelotrichaceae bacterium]|nr:hypothetical protein AwErysi_05220 [Erysipelotrichaceae bacterium]